ncbi:MAG: transporter ATP-binding protein [Moraxellaceae bacterium]|jgi:putative ABC transport system ATP-binding protein|nr:transporter ATP-binding protein [Moraxellaceae bacterium]
MIRVIGVHKTFRLGDQLVQALQGINLEIGRGDYLSVMGPSGSGKSTLLNMLGLLDRPDRGQYFLNDTDTVPLPEEARARLRGEHIGFIFQSFHLIPRLTARENVELPLVLAGVAPELRRPQVEAVLDQLGILARADHGATQLSGGERQRVAIGRALVMKPELLLADEPTGNLDSASGREVMALLEDLNRQGLTLLVVTHDPALGQRARRRLRMVDGAIVQDERG